MNFPHSNLFTRIGVAADGVGVFAIREIPKETKLFAGDVGKTVRIPVSDIDKVQDPELRRMYYDFCPVIDQSFLAPVDFNQMTMAWYLNHANDPNVAVDADLQFFATRMIEIGEELTADYTMYSEHASAFTERWLPRK